MTLQNQALLTANALRNLAKELVADSRCNWIDRVRAKALLTHAADLESAVTREYPRTGTMVHDIAALANPEASR